MNELLNLARDSAAAAVAALRSEFIDNAGILHAKGRDIKTQADLTSQEHILQRLATSGIPVIAEEGDHTTSLNGERCWLVDPLDGTLNFSRGFPMAAVSIALWEGDKPLLGVIQDVFSGDVYSGQVGSGAWLGNAEMQVSITDRKDQAVLATGFPVARDYSTGSLQHFIDSVQSYKKVRMLGSAAMMIAQVAAGRFDVYEEDDIFLWDVAAGIALVKAAGGTYTMEPGAGPFQYHVRASNGRV